MTGLRLRQRVQLIAGQHEDGRRKRMWTRRTTALAGMAAMLLWIGYYTGVGWSYVIEAMLLSLLVVAFLLSRWELRGVDGSRSVAPYAFEGDQVLVRLILENRSRQAKTLLELRDRFPAGSPEAGEVIRLVEMLDAGRRVSRSYQARAYRRGRYVFGPLEVRSGGPFGILFAGRRIPQPTTLLVYPTVDTLPTGFLNHTVMQLPQTTSEARLGDDQQFRSIRDFRAGDARRWIHWRSSARLGRLIVKQFERQQQIRLALILDNEVGHSLGHDGETTFEYVVKAAASLVYQAYEEGHTVDLIWASRDGVVFEKPGDRWEALAHLAEVEPSSYTPFPRLLSHFESGELSDALVVALLPLPREEDVAALSSMPGETWRIVAVLADRESFDSSHPPVRTLDAQLRSRGIRTFVLTRGGSISAALMRTV